MNDFYIIITLTVVVASVGARSQHVVNKTRPASYSFDGIKVDPDAALRERMISHKQILLAEKGTGNLRKQIEAFLEKYSPFYRKPSICADYWIISYDYTDYILETAKRLPTWCVVVVREEHDYIGELPSNIFLFNGPFHAKLSYISPFYKESLRLPKGLYSAKKNLGYLWAIYHQAKVIYDYDHNNELISNQSVLPFPLGEQFEAFTFPKYKNKFFNPYSYLGSMNNLYLRGYPFRIHAIMDKKPSDMLYDTFPTEKLALIHALAEGYKDEYNTFWLSKPNQPLHLKFQGNDSKLHARVVAPPRTFSPYDQQSTLHLKPGFWALMLPTTVKQYATDTVRSYIMQRLMWDVDQQIAFSGSYLASRFKYFGVEDTIVHFRKLRKTRQSEYAFYWQIDTLAYFLAGWSSKEKDFVERAEQLFLDLHKRDFIQLYDAYLFQLWLYELTEVGYVLPKIVS